MTTNSRYTPAILTGLAIGLVGLFVAGVFGSPTLGFAEQYESAWEIPNWGSTSFPATPRAIALGDQAVLLRTLHIFLDQGLAFLLVPPLFLCALLKLSDFAKQFILARAANRTIWLAISFTLGTTFAAIAGTAIMPDEALSIHDFVIAACHLSVGTLWLLWRSTEFHWGILIFFLIQLGLCALCKIERVDRTISWFHQRIPYSWLAVTCLVTAVGLPVYLSHSVREHENDWGLMLATYLAQVVVLIVASGCASFFLWCKWTVSRLRRSEL